MANVKPEDTDHSIWQGYVLQPPTSNSSHIQAYDANFQPASLSNPYHDRPQKNVYRSMDIPTLQTRPLPRNDHAGLTASPPTLNSHHSYPSLKRPFDTGNERGYMENLQDYREDLPEMQKVTMNQDHRLLNFGSLPDKHTLLDSQGRVKQIELTAQIHGMFFLSELAGPSAAENIINQPELTCYRRNLFQISGNVTAPREPLSVHTERGERIPIVSLEVCISATESVDGHIVKLIVIPWKTPPPNSPETPAGLEHEPTSIPLVAFEESPEAVNSGFTVFPIAYRRLQFRIATANNGRRRELQQHFTLHLNVVGTLANGVSLVVCENSTAPIVVRGRSPRNFQARKEIPLVGSSSSRGHPPELHVTTQSPMVQRRGSIMKPGNVELPSLPFTFDSSSISGSPSLVRQSTYPQWSTSQQTQPQQTQQQIYHTPITSDQHPSSTNPHTPSSAYPSSEISLDTFLQPTHLSSPHHHPRSATMPMPALNRPQYNFPLSYPQTQSQDHNPRPAKSLRHQAPPELPSIYSSSNPDYGTRNVTTYTSVPGGLPPLVSTITSLGSGSEYCSIPPTLISMPMPMSLSMALPPAWSVAGLSAPQGGYEGILPVIVETEGGAGYELQGANGVQQHQQQQQQAYVKGEGGNAVVQGNYTWGHEA